MAGEIDHPGSAARWLQWLRSIKPGRNPVSDTTGQFAAEAQPMDIWFLAGTYGGRVERSCSPPAGRPLFFPLFNMWSGGPDVPVCPNASGHATLNGIDLPIVPVGNPDPIKVNRFPGSRLAGRTTLRMWGLWSYVPGLVEPGTHHLEIYGEHSPGGFWTQVNYDLQIK